LYDTVGAKEAQEINKKLGATVAVNVELVLELRRTVLISDPKFRSASKSENTHKTVTLY
jgi:hypothetical protein